MKCCRCECELDKNDTYEYHGFYSCPDCFDAVIPLVDNRRKLIFDQHNNRTKKLKGLDLDSRSIIGKANREIFKEDLKDLEIESLLESNFRKGVL